MAFHSFTSPHLGSYFLSYKKFHDFPWLFSFFPWLIIHNSVKYIQWNFCLSWYTTKIDSDNFFIVIKFSMTFHDSTQNSMTFQAWKAKKQNSMTFQVFQDPYEPCPRTSSPKSNDQSLPWCIHGYSIFGSCQNVKSNLTFSCSLRMVNLWIQILQNQKPFTLF